VNFYEVIEATKRAGPTVLDLATGAPLLLPEVSEALAEALEGIAQSPGTPELLGSYTHLDGVPSLVEQFVDRCSSEFGTCITPDQIVVTPGAQAALRYIQELVRQSGKRIMYPVDFEFPGAIDYQANDRCFGPYGSINVDQNICLPTINFDRLDWQGVGAVCLSRPHNPTGCYWSFSAIDRLAALAAGSGALMVLDETYAMPFAPLIANGYSPVHATNMVHVYSFSKVGLAAERVAVVVAPAPIAQGLRDIQRRQIIQSPKLGQLLALALVQFFHDRPDVANRFGEVYLERWCLFTAALGARGLSARGIRCTEFGGGPFVWCEWRGVPSSDEIFSRLLVDGVSVAPGSALRLSPRAASGDYDGIRIGLGIAIGDLERGADRIGRLLASLDFAATAVENKP